VNQRLLETVLKHTAEGGPIAILGLAYKPFTGVTERSPGLWLAQELANHQRKVLAHDYMAGSALNGAINGGLQLVPQPDELFQGQCSTFVITCPWPNYLSLFKKAKHRRQARVIIDPWSLLAGLKLQKSPAIYLNTLN
jgi:UDP-glucose 6-dehydrogenase